MSKDYVPTFNDVLRSRVRTTGIIETQIQVDDVSYRYGRSLLSTLALQLFSWFFAVSGPCSFRCLTPY